MKTKRILILSSLAFVLFLPFAMDFFWFNLRLGYKIKAVGDIYFNLPEKPPGSNE